jgi:outer membrane protein OmpA-like peptidoglycan-associated protein/opacity protein-like surface antigen
MRLSIAAIVLIALSGAAFGQNTSDYKNDTPMFNFSAGYERTQANAPPGTCQCFSANGGYISGSFFFSNHLSAEARFSGATSSNISSLGQNLNLYTIVAGPKLSFTTHRFSPYVHVLFGEAHATNSYFPTATSYTTTATSFALAPGGGVDLSLSPHWSVRLVEAEYLRTGFPNGSTNTQNQLQIGAGIVYKFRRRSLPPPAKSSPAPEPVIETSQPQPFPATQPQLFCSADATSVPAGQAVAVTARLATETPGGVFAWSTSGGRILGDGSRVSVDTNALPPGNYTASASRQSPTGGVTNCDVTFSVTAPPPMPEPLPAPQPALVDDTEFHANIHDVYFDLNQSSLRPDAVKTIASDAEYLVAHKNIRIQIGGFADQRGSSKYNLALGERRANAVKDKLIEDGVDSSRIQIVTFGRDAQKCTADNETCWQQNRRVGFLRQP